MSNTIQDSRLKLSAFFTEYKGSRTAFCRETNLSMEGLRRILSGRVQSLDRLQQAAEFMQRWKAKADRERQRKEKQTEAVLQNVLGALGSPTPSDAARQTNTTHP